MIVARPRAVPIPLPFIAFGPTRLNLGEKGSEKRSTRTNEEHNVHGRVLQHVWYNEEANHTATNVHLIKLRHTTVTASYSNVLQRNVQVILGY